MLKTLKESVNGGFILSEWLGDGGMPVPQPQANHRAYVCVNCPLNIPGNWWDRNFKDPIAATIKAHLEVKNQMNLITESDYKLGTCKVCGCNNPLAVWCPIEHIANHTSEEEIAKFPEHCWKKYELLNSR